MKKNIKDESSFPNSRYYIKRLENADLKLFKYDSKSQKDKYAKKCQASNNTQPLALTREEYDQINVELKKYGQTIQQKAFSIAGRDPDILYICQKYWDRKNQLIIEPDEEENHPIEDDYIGDLIYHKKDNDASKYVLHRDNGKYEMNFIQNIHPHLYALPCCGKKNKNLFTIGDTVNVLVNGGDRSELLWDEADKKNKKNPSIRWENANKLWEKGKIVSELKGETYEIDVNGKTNKYHISMLDKYNDTGKLSQVFPLSQGSIGTVSPILKNIFHIRDDCPNMIQKYKNGFYRVGIQQNSDTLLSAVLLHVNKYNRGKVSLDEFKKYIVKDLKNTEMKLSSIAGGAFIHCFRSETFFPEKKYSLRAFLKYQKQSSFSKKLIMKGINYKKKKDQELITQFKELPSSEQIKITTDFIELSVIENFKEYLHSNEFKHEGFLLSLFNEISKLPNNKTFQSEYITDLTILILEEKGEKIKIGNPINKLLWNDNSSFSFIYKKEGKYEPLLYQYNNAKLSFLKNIEDKKIDIQKDIVYEDTIARLIKKLPNNEYLVHLKDSDEEQNIPKSEIIIFDQKHIIECITQHIHYKSYLNDKECLPSSILIPIMKTLGYQVIKNHCYHDTYYKISHITFNESSKMKQVILPILPENIQEYKSKEIQHLPKQSLKDILLILEKIDKIIIDDIGGKYKPFLLGKEKILVDKKKMKYLLFENGSVIRLDNENYNYRIHKIPSSENKTMHHLIENQLVQFYEESQYDILVNEYNTSLDVEYTYFTTLYLQLRQNETIIKKIQLIKNHPIKIGIHKRKEIVSLLENMLLDMRKTKISYAKIIIKDESKKSIYLSKIKEIELILKILKKNQSFFLKKFTECVYLNNIQELDKLFIYTYLSLNTLNTLNKETSTEYIFSQRQILMNEHASVFLNQSKYLRQVSYYNTHNPFINAKLINMKEKSNLVSYYTSYPHKMKHYFGFTFKMYKHFGEINDFDVTDYALKSVESISSRELLIDCIEKNPTIINNYNECEWSDKQYQTEIELIESIKKEDYKIQYFDLYILSGLLSDSDSIIGFCFYTNQYGQHKKDFDLHIILNEEILKGSLGEINMICIYQDYYADDFQLKNIIFPKDKRNITIHELYYNESLKRNEFRKLWDEEIKMNIL